MADLANDLHREFRKKVVAALKVVVQEEMLEVKDLLVRIMEEQSSLFQELKRTRESQAGDPQFGKQPVLLQEETVMTRILLSHRSVKGSASTRPSSLDQLEGQLAEFLQSSPSQTGAGGRISALIQPRASTLPARASVIPVPARSKTGDEIDAKARAASVIPVPACSQQSGSSHSSGRHLMLPVPAQVPDVDGGGLRAISPFRLQGILSGDDEEKLPSFVSSLAPQVPQRLKGPKPPASRVGHTAEDPEAPPDDQLASFPSPSPQEPGQIPNSVGCENRSDLFSSK
ncbi:unnamed protein product [Polarella glacialis]|uniref:Uncharacterized protein n=1 Tax=Polarella glacialis TaxID=89957 RepID=A0A813E0N6_POLGL|nr:unnamed protein product [Polarella glacialis]